MNLVGPVEALIITLAHSQRRKSGQLTLRHRRDILTHLIHPVPKHVRLLR